MSDYDFKPLNDKEFEVLCNDLLGEVEGRRFERFKAGRDSGVDGRYFVDERKEVVLQCKHWVNTPVRQLIHRLGTDEKPKLAKLKLSRYVLAVSNPLSRADKKAIFDVLAPFIKSESDIYGQEDLNDLLKKKKGIEQRHYKLWLHSASVLGHVFNSAILGRSAYSIEEILRASARYVVTENHSAALRTLEKLGVVIITGEPGVGKTTLAEQLCLHYIAKGFEFLQIAEDVREAEAAFYPEEKQIIYFDDFLGRNYLEALRGHEGNHITQFIRRVAANKKKRFVLTSRSTILNQGKLLMDSLEHGNVQKNEYELTIKSLSALDKAHILYNHIWHSNLSDEYIEQLYKERRYRAVISHNNFNPRLINYVTDATRLERCAPGGYWGHVLNSLANPAGIWENPFDVQEDDFGRAIIFLVVLNGAAIGEDVLGTAYQRYIALPENQSLRGRREFHANIRQLTGSFLNRRIQSKGEPTIDLFNPSIGDYVLRRYAGNLAALRLGMVSLRTYHSLQTMQNLQRAKMISTSHAFSIFEELMRRLAAEGFRETSAIYVAALYRAYAKCGGSDLIVLRAALSFIMKDTYSATNDDFYHAVNHGLKNGLVSAEDAVTYAERTFEDVAFGYEVHAIAELLSTVPTDTEGLLELQRSVRSHVLEVVADSTADFIDITDAFVRVDHQDYKTAYQEVERLVEKKLNDFGLDFDSDDVTEIMDRIDVDSELDQYQESSSEDGYYDRAEGPSVSPIDEIDDLFDRSNRE